MIEELHITGATTAEALAARADETRVLGFPDGVARHITMPGRYWSALETVVAEDGAWASLGHYMADKFEVTAWAVAETPGGDAALLEMMVRRTLPTRILIDYHWLQHCRRRPVNDVMKAPVHPSQAGAYYRAPDLYTAWRTATDPDLY